MRETRPLRVSAPCGRCAWSVRARHTPRVRTAQPSTQHSSWSVLVLATARRLNRAQLLTRGSVPEYNVYAGHVGDVG